MRHPKIAFTTIALVAALAGAGCQRPPIVPAYTAPTDITLPTGKKFTVLMNSTASGKTLSLWMLSYRTEQSPDDRAALQKEVDEIWVTLRAEADKKNVTQVMITPSAIVPNSGPVPKEHGVQFSFKKVDGAWQRGP